jgi:hypothetical protein
MPNARSVSKLKAVAPKAAKKLEVKERIEFNPVQERIADAVADMLVHGSPNERNLVRLINATISHDLRLKFSTVTDAKISETIHHLKDNEGPGMLAALAQARVPRQAFTERVSGASQGIVERIRETARTHCQSELQEFIEHGSPEDIRLMHAVMVNYGSGHYPALTDTVQCDAGLASAFMEEIDSKQNYVRVPSGMMHEVEGYIEALTKVRAATEVA